jgi:hypothetical protein
LGHATLSSFARIDEVDTLITSQLAPAEFLTGLESRGRKFHLAPLPI